MKIFFTNLYYWIQINLILLLLHAWAFIPVAFNDIDIKFNNFIELIPYMLKGLFPLLIGSYILHLLFKKKKNFNINIYIILQLITIILWILFYYNNLVI